MTLSSRTGARGSFLLGPFRLALLAVFVTVHMVSCLPFVHDPGTGADGGHSLTTLAGDAPVSAAHHSSRASLPRSSAVVRDKAGHDGDGHHASCVAIGVLGSFEGSVLLLAGALLAALLVWSLPRSGAGAAAGRTPARAALPADCWLRRALRGAMLPAALGVSRT